MKKKIAFIDMDGTLLHSRYYVSDTNLEMLKKASKNVEIVIATGRSIADCLFVLERCPFIRYIVASNGALVKDLKENKFIFESKMDIEDLISLSKYVKRNKLKLSIHNDMIQYVNELGELPEKADTLLKEDLVDFVSKNDITQVVMIGSGIERMIRAKKYVLKNKNVIIQNQSIQLKKYMKENVIIPSDEPLYYFMDITNTNVDKGVGILKLSEYLGYDKKDIIAIGNGMNDVPMFEVAGCAAVVENALAEIKKHGDVIIDSNTNDGVGKYLVTLVK